MRYSSTMKFCSQRGLPRNYLEKGVLKLVVDHIQVRFENQNLSQNTRLPFSQNRIFCKIKTTRWLSSDNMSIPHDPDFGRT